MRKIRFASITAGFTILAIAAGCLGTVGDGDTYKVGVIAPLTGPAAAYGEVVRNVLTLANEKVTASGGAEGKNIEFQFEDGQCDPKYGTAAAEKLVNVDQVKFIIGGACSGETLSAASVTEPAKVIMLSPSASSPKISEAGDYVFRTYPSDMGKGNALAKYVIDKKFKKVATIAEQTDYALAIKDVFDKAIKAGGIESIVETYTSESSDFRTQLTKFKNAKVDAIFIDPQGADKGPLILDQMKEMNFKPQLLTQEVLGTDTAALAKAKAFVEGMITADVVPPVGGGIENLRRDYKAKFGKDLNYESISAGTWDAFMVMKDALAASKGDVEKAKTYLYSIQSYLGLNGVFGFDKNGDPTLTHALLVIKDGKPVPVK